MTTAMAKRSRSPALSVAVVMAVVMLLLVGLPLAAWLDLQNLSERSLLTQAHDLNTVITGVRNFYARNVVGRLVNTVTAPKIVHNYADMPGAIPIPATLSIELGHVITTRDGSIRYRSVSDYPFASRDPHLLDPFEQRALQSLRRNPKDIVYDISGSIFDKRVRLAAPVIMGEACVACHNSHGESPKRDWKVGDVRGIQEVILQQSLATNIFAFKYLLSYFALAAAVGIAFILLQRRQARLISGINRELEEANDFLASISMKIAKYLSPQVYKGIFSGQRDVVIATERKKLTIFFSDIKDFTATTERLQPEEITNLLNEYLTEMSKIAQTHGGTLDKFIGDAILVFFGDPETKGVAQDAQACLYMALDMQRKLTELNAKWRQRGVEQPLAIRMGINTGFCNVGNFGSDDRMEYTIIGAEANLAARLQAIAEPGGMVMSYETYALVRDMVRARPLPSIAMKGISHEVVPYAIEGLLGELGQRTQVISEHTTGLDLFLDTEVVDDRAAEHARRVLGDAIAALDARQPRVRSG